MDGWICRPLSSREHPVIQDPGEAPESAFEFQPTKINTMVGGLVSWMNRDEMR